MGFRRSKIAKRFFSFLIAGTVAVVASSVVADKISSNTNTTNQAYVELLNNCDVGATNLEYNLPFGNYQICLTKQYTDLAKTQLGKEDYKLFVRSFSEPLAHINNLKVGYHFDLCSEDASFGLPAPNSSTKVIKWDVSNLPGNCIGIWKVDKTLFSTTYQYYQDKSTVGMIFFPKGLETDVDLYNINTLDSIVVCGKEYSPATLVANYKIVLHEVGHSIGLDHITDTSKVPHDEYGIAQTNMTETLNEDFVGTSDYDDRTLIIVNALKKIIQKQDNIHDDNFDDSHYDTFNQATANNEYDDTLTN